MRKDAPLHCQVVTLSPPMLRLLNQKLSHRIQLISLLLLLKMLWTEMLLTKTL
jgi:hypothetical protein